MKPRFSIKWETVNTIILTERDLIKKNEKLIAHIFDNYFGNSKKT